MFREQFVQIKERFVKPRPIDLAQKLLDEKFQYLELQDQEIGVFGVDFLKGQMGTEPLKNLTIAKTLAKEKAVEFSRDVSDNLTGTQTAEKMKERLEGILAYGALEITRQVLNDSDMSYRKKKRQLVFLETFLGENRIPAEYSNLLIREGKKEAKRVEIIRNVGTAAKFVFGAALGFFGADIAEKYVSFVPAAQEALGIAIVVGTTAGRLVTKMNSEKSPKWKKADKLLATVQPLLTGIGAGMIGYGLFDQLGHQSEAIVKGVSTVSKNLSKPELPKPVKPILPTQPSPHLQPPVQPVVPETPVVPTQIVETAKYTVTGIEHGGVTDVIAHFHQDPYGEAMTKFILQNRNVFTDQSRSGHEAAEKLINFLQSHPTYTWRDAMNESARAGHATDISKTFTESLKIIRPGTVFNVPVQ